MTNLSRITAKIFGETAATTGDDPEIGQFGSALAGTYVGTADVATIQSLPAWSNGFIDSVTPSTQFPPLPEVTGFGKVLSYQNAYLLQKGIAEWDSATVYYTTSYCQYNGALYRSKINDNIGNEPIANVSNDYWQFLGKDFLNTQQVANCLLEVPQRIDYTLVNGEFTLKAGSVVIVPYGTTDLSSTINVGDAFIHSDLKVYDTYWDSTNSKFYVWAELQADVVRTASASNAGIVRALALYFDSSTIGITAYGNAESGSSDSSASNTSLCYNTSSNLVKRKDSGTILAYTCSFPIVKVISNATYMVAEVRQVFNGIGYIGAITWADKGIKGLIPNGRNADGTLKNDEFTTQTLMTYAVSASLGLSGYRYICLSADALNSVNPMNAFYNALENTFRLTGGSHVAKIGTILTDSNGKIISQSLDGALNINSMCDGGWVDLDLTLASSVTAPSSGTPLEYDLSNYLPIDGNNYEVTLTGSVTTGTTSGNMVSLRVYSNILNNYQTITTAQTRSSSSVSGGGTLTLPVGLDKKIYVSSYSGNNGTFSLFARGYRRLGTNA